MITGSLETLKRARKLRSEMSPPQAMLWRELRKRPGGFKFRREHPAGHYVLDFYVASLELDIEVDGFGHDSEPAVARDQHRSQWLRSKGVATIRVPARAILDDVEAVIVRIVQICEERSAKRNPPPPGEGDHAKHGGGVGAATDATSRRQASANAPLHQPLAGPPPRAGED